MSKLKVYGVAGSRAYRTLWMVNELGLEYENLPIHFADGSAKTFDETGLVGWGARIRTWEWRNQNPLPYHLATPQLGAICRAWPRYSMSWNGVSA